MKIDVGEILKAVGREMEIDGSEILSFAKEEIKAAGPVNYKFKLVNTGGQVLLKGEIDAKVKLTCCRCLEEFTFPVSFAIEEEYSKQVGRARKKSGDDEEKELTEDDFVFRIGEDNSIDIFEAVRQNILTHLPIRPLCKKQCKGLDSGAKKEKQIDPRMAKLKDILKQGGI